MAFPTTVPANKTLRYEDNLPFRVKDGRWNRQREKYVQEASGNGIALVGIARHRITVNSVYSPSGNGDLKVNINANGWVDMSKWVHGAAQLISGSSSWRHGDWKGAMNPGNDGYILNWVQGNNDWLLQDNMHHTSELNFVDYGNAILLNWTLLYKSSTNQIAMIRGNVAIEKRIHDITSIAFNTSAGSWRFAKHHVEIV